MLKHILCVPSTAKNLLSISKFTQDNDAFAEFTSNSCAIKDKNSEAILLKGKLENGLYKLKVGGVQSKLATRSLKNKCFTAFQLLGIKLPALHVIHCVQQNLYLAILVIQIL